MLVRPVQEISQVMMKWCRRASHLGSFFVAQRPPSYTTQYIYFVAPTTAETFER